MQGRRRADIISPVGSFSDFTSTTRQSSCVPAEVKTPSPPSQHSLALLECPWFSSLVSRTFPSSSFNLLKYAKSDPCVLTYYGVVYMTKSSRPFPTFSFWQSAVTHNSPVDKTCEVLTWTAPPNGTGPVVFQWAVVVRYSTGSVNMFYAPLTTMMINESETCRGVLLQPVFASPIPKLFPRERAWVWD